MLWGLIGKPAIIPVWQQIVVGVGHTLTVYVAPAMAVAIGWTLGKRCAGDSPYNNESERLRAGEDFACGLERRAAQARRSQQHVQ